MDYKIIINSTSDLPKDYIEKNDLGLMRLSYIFGDDEYSGETGRELEEKVFYDRIRKGELPTTSQVNPDQAKRIIEGYLEETKNILILCFSSGLSGTYYSVRVAIDEILDERDDVNIIAIDSLCASLGEGLFVHKAVENKKNGMSFEENAKWLEENKLHVVHCFTVDDLFHLYRGGRVKRGAAIVGSLINIKPILHVDNSGQLINLSTVRGRKKALKLLVDYMGEHMGSWKDKNDVVFISHSDCEDDAKFVAEEIKNRFGIDNFLINYIGPTIGSHTGCGTVALFFMGDVR